MSRAFHIAKNIFAGIGLIVFLLIVGFSFVAMWKAPIHQFNLWKLERNFSTINSHHPEDSKYVLRVKHFGNLFRAASNGCDYLVGEMRAGKRSPQEIAQRYQGLFIKSFDGTAPVPIEVRFFDKEEDWMDPYPWSDWRNKAQSYADPAAMKDTLYMVFARQTDYPPDGGIRCFLTTPI